MRLHTHLLQLLAPFGAGDEVVPGARLVGVLLEIGLGWRFRTADGDVNVEVALLDDRGRAVWDRHGVIGGAGDDASFVTNTTRLVDFTVERPGPYSFQVGFPEGSQDDLREARIELRHGAAPFDPRVTWGFGLAAFACLLVNLLSPRSESYPSPLPITRDDAREDWREPA